MKVRRLQLESQELARLRIETQMAQLSINAPKRRIKAIQNDPPQMTVSSEDPVLEVDMERLHNNIGLKSPPVLMQDRVAQARSKSNQNIKNYENNGDAVAALPHGQNPIATIARSSLLKVNPPSTPSGKPSDPTVDITSYEGSLNIDWSIQDISISWDEYQSPVITIEPKPSVDISLEQQGYVAFKVVELTIPAETGRTIDQEA